MADKQLVEMIMSGEGKGADLRSADLTYAKLQGANLRGADLYQANLKGADLADADLADADLYDANLQGAYLEGANLEGVNLAVADLWGANLWGTDLWGANLQGAKLQGAILTRANFTGANLEGVNLSLADLIHAKLQGANLKGAYFQYANLTNANLQDADLNGADLTNAKKIENAILKGVKYDSNTVWPRGFTPPGEGSGRMASHNRTAAADQELVEMIMSGGGAGADLRSENLAGADLRDADLQGADLAGADLRDADLKGADLYDANLYGTDFTGADLTGADLRDANLYKAILLLAILKGAKITNADLQGANLQRTDLSGADLRGADLQDADLEDTNLTNADLQGANLKVAYLAGANLTNADLQGAYLRGADLKGADLRGVKYDAKTKWPEGFTPPGDGSGRMASRASKKASGDPLLLNVNIDPRLLTQSTSSHISGYQHTEDLVTDYNKGSVSARSPEYYLYYINLDYAGAGLDLEGCFKVPSKLAKELLAEFTKRMDAAVEEALYTGRRINEEAEYDYANDRFVLDEIDFQDIQTTEYEETGELALIGETKSLRAISANVTDTPPSWSKDYLHNSPKSLYISGTCEIAYGEGDIYEVSFEQNFGYKEYPEDKYNISTDLEITPGVIKTMYCVELPYADLVKLRKMGKIASRNRKASTNW